MVTTDSESPIVVVLSGSMEPAFHRGDLLFLTNRDEPVRVGEIVVFKIDGRDIPIVHRVIKLHERYTTWKILQVNNYCILNIYLWFLFKIEVTEQQNF